MYLLDTDYAVLMQRGTGPELIRLLQRMATHEPEHFFYSVVSFHEQMLGANAFISQARTKEKIVRGYAMLERILTDFSSAQVLPFDEVAADACNRLGRVRIGTMDSRIAATALSRNMTVLTRNLVDFGRVPGIKVEDWTQK